MKNKTNFFERLTKLITDKGYKSLNDFAVNGLGYKSSEKLNRLKDDHNKPSLTIIEDIANAFAEVNLNWLIMGTGNMYESAAIKEEPEMKEKFIQLQADYIELQKKFIEKSQLPNSLLFADKNSLYDEKISMLNEPEVRLTRRSKKNPK